MVDESKPQSTSDLIGIPRISISGVVFHDKMTFTPMAIDNVEGSSRYYDQRIKASDANDFLDISLTCSTVDEEGHHEEKQHLTPWLKTTGVLKPNVELENMVWKVPLDHKRSDGVWESEHVPGSQWPRTQVGRFDGSGSAYREGKFAYVLRIPSDALLVAPDKALETIDSYIRQNRGHNTGSCR